MRIRPKFARVADFTIGLLGAMAFFVGYLTILRHTSGWRSALLWLPIISATVAFVVATAFELLNDLILGKVTVDHDVEDIRKQIMVLSQDIERINAELELRLTSDFEMRTARRPKRRVYVERLSAAHRSLHEAAELIRSE